MEYICSLLAQWCPLNNSKTSRCPLQWGVPFPCCRFPQHCKFPISFSHSFVIMTDMISFSIYKMSILLLWAGHFLLSCHCFLLSLEALVAPKVSISVPWLQSLSAGMCEGLGTIPPPACQTLFCSSYPCLPCCCTCGSSLQPQRYSLSFPWIPLILISVLNLLGSLFIFFFSFLDQSWLFVFKENAIYCKLWIPFQIPLQSLQTVIVAFSRLFQAQENMWLSTAFGR